MATTCAENHQNRLMSKAKTHESHAMKLCIRPAHMCSLSNTWCLSHEMWQRTVLIPWLAVQACTHWLGGRQPPGNRWCGVCCCLLTGGDGGCGCDDGDSPLLRYCRPPPLCCCRPPLLRCCCLLLHCCCCLLLLLENGCSSISCSCTHPPIPSHPPPMIDYLGSEEAVDAAS